LASILDCKVGLLSSSLPLLVGYTVQLGRRWWSFLLVLALLTCTLAQSASTGGLVGVVLDPSGLAVPGAIFRVINTATSRSESTVSDEFGRFSFLSLAPGSYEVQASKAGFASFRWGGINVSVTERHRVEIHLQLAAVHNRVEVSTADQLAETDSAALGRLVDETAVRSLPLATRNFAQITGLSPGVAAGVFNAGELGLGGTALSQIATSNDGIFVHGTRSYDNNWELDGISVSDVQGSGFGSGGIPTPNPDAIQEFKVQTGLYDAAYGRYAGANISVVTKSGSNEYHGTVFEFFRNDVTNANDFFLKQTGQPRSVLRQNQFGFILGGPIKKNKFLFFGSYQGTRQLNGLAAGQARIACTASLSEPPLTNDRSPAELGKLFGGMTGKQGGLAVEPDGSNINPVALELLNFKLPDGNFLIPAPQTVDSTKPFANQGFSVVSQPCRFDEDQFSTNADYLASEKTKISGRFFFADNRRTVSFPGNFYNPAANITGFSSPGDGSYRVFSLDHSYTISSAWLNEARIGYVGTRSATHSRAPFKWSDVGVAEGATSQANDLPNLNILGSVAFASAFPFTFTQRGVAFTDTLSFVHGAHDVRLGGSLTRLHDNFDDAGIGSFVQFLSWPDFLLGLDAAANGTGTSSNVFASMDLFGLLDRQYRAWEGSVFVQDDYKVCRSLTVSIGLRYERLGQFGDKLGRNSSFDIGKADPNPPSSGSVAGYVVAENFSGTVPPSAEKTDNTLANRGLGQNGIAPRIGFAWRVLPDIDRLVLRGGYGIYFSRPTGQAFFQNGNGAPFSLLRLNVGEANAGATFQSPFPQPFPTSESFPLFPPYSPSTAISVFTTSPGFRPAMVQQFGLNFQAELEKGWLAEIGYVGTRGTNLQRVRSLNQALDASPTYPIRGVTSDTVANIALRVPILGIPADSLDEVESEGSSWYNGLEASLTKRMGHGLQFLAAYTLSKTLDSDGANINGTSAGTALTLGDQNSPKQRWGRTSFDRTHRFVVSEIWSLPSPAHGLQRELVGGLNLAAVLTIQSGTALTIADTNADNVFGISEDRAQLSGLCSKSQLIASGSVLSKLNGYFNRSCFTSPPIIGADSIGTAFGNSSTGIVDGPGQANIDIAFSKSIPVHESSKIQFRAEFFNALNHPQFANPDTNLTSPTFGVISATAVNPRVGQLALEFAF
jgi:hypothetical protein